MDAATLREAMGRKLSLERYAAALPGFEAAMRAAGCTTVPRAAMWCAQVGHESLGLFYQGEGWGPTAQQLKYDPASGSDLSRRLGNTQPGDGYRFRGRGRIQLTGRGNYARFGAWCHARGLVPSAAHFTRNPDLVAAPPWCDLAAAWFWTVERPKLNALSDTRDLEGATRAINGGTTGLDDRRKRYAVCLRLGDRLLPAPASEEDDDMPSAQEIAAAVWQQPIEDLYTPQGGDTMPAFAALGWAAAHGAFARQAGQAALSEVVGLRVAVEKLSGALGTAQGIDPAALEQAVRDGVARALAESVRVEGDLHLTPAPPA